MNKTLRFGGLLALTILLAAGCASRALTVEYRLEAGMSGRGPVRLVVEDRRSTEAASASLPGGLFAGGGDSLTLEVIRGGNRQDAYPLTAPREAVRAALTARLRAAGFDVAAQPALGGRALTVDLTEFSLRRDGRYYRARVVFEAVFSRGGEEYRRKTVDGRAERFHLPQRAAAQEALSQAFSIAVNHLDLDPLI
jgi:hypothetical protein